MLFISACFPELCVLEYVLRRELNFDPSTRPNSFFWNHFQLSFKAKVRMRNRETTPIRMLTVEAEVRRLLFSALGNQLVAQRGE